MPECKQFFAAKVEVNRLLRIMTALLFILLLLHLSIVNKAGVEGKLNHWFSTF
jgi:hypothetical protein